MNRIIYFVFLFFFLGNTVLLAQNKTLNDFKYSASVDMLGLFKNGYPDKVIFKVFNHDNNEIKGAWRLGLDSRLNSLKILIKDENQPFHTSYRSNYNALNLTAGYEWHKSKKYLVYYGGFDIKSSLGLENVKKNMYDTPHKNPTYAVGLVPFLGFEYQITKMLYTSFEMGLSTTFLYNKHHSSITNLENIEKQYQITTHLKTPYSLTINYKF